MEATKKKDIIIFNKLKNLSNNLSLFKINNEIFIISERLNIFIKVKKDGYIPKSGLLITDYLDKINIYGNTLDIGTGETGLLASYMNAKGANTVTGCDLDESVIKYVKKASLIKNEINWIISDVFSNIKKEGFDFIISNPPQLPIENDGDLHDYGG